jgi:hypothetical protein
MKNFFSKFYLGFVQFFHTLHLNWLEWWTTRLTFILNSWMRRLIILKGKDPDYVAPPPPPAPSPYDYSSQGNTDNLVHGMLEYLGNRKVTKKFSELDVVKGTPNHPVLKSRQAWDLAQIQAKAKEAEVSDKSVSNVIASEPQAVIKHPVGSLSPTEATEILLALPPEEPVVEEFVEVLQEVANQKDVKEESTCSSVADLQQVQSEEKMQEYLNSKETKETEDTQKALKNLIKFADMLEAADPNSSFSMRLKEFKNLKNK